jgi:hypothetical protein
VVFVDGFIKLIEANKVDVELNPFNTNPLPSCAVVDGINDLESGADTLCPNPKNEISKKNITNNFFILFND